MKTEKEINDAIAIVQKASREGRIQVKCSSGPWQRAVPFSPALSYRVKPDPVERWLVIYPDGSSSMVTVKESAERQAKNGPQGTRIVHLREVK